MKAFSESIVDQVLAGLPIKWVVETTLIDVEAYRGWLNENLGEGVAHSVHFDPAKLANAFNFFQNRKAGWITPEGTYDALQPSETHHDWVDRNKDQLVKAGRAEFDQSGNFDKHRTFAALIHKHGYIRHVVDDKFQAAAHRAAAPKVVGFVKKHFPNLLKVRISSTDPEGYDTHSGEYAIEGGRTDTKLGQFHTPAAQRKRALNKHFDAILSGRRPPDPMLASELDSELRAAREMGRSRPRRSRNESAAAAVDAYLAEADIFHKERNWYGVPHNLKTRDIDTVLKDRKNRGGWISPEGKIHAIESGHYRAGDAIHSEVIGKLGYDGRDYHAMKKHGYVRFVDSKGESDYQNRFKLELHANHPDALANAKTFLEKHHRPGQQIWLDTGGGSDTRVFDSQDKNKALEHLKSFDSQSSFRY